MSEYCENCYKLQAQYDKVVEQNRQLQAENRELLNIINLIGTFDFTECNKTCPNNVGKIINKLLKGAENERQI